MTKQASTIKASLNSITLKLTDKAIREQQKNRVRELNDPSLPIRVRFHKDREKATLWLVKYIKGQGKWHRVGYWPELSFTALKKDLALYQQKLFLSGRVEFNAFTNTGDLLDWYLEVIEQSKGKRKGLSMNRYYNIRSTVNKHLKPALKNVVFDDLDQALIQEVLINPLYKDYCASTTIQYFKVLKAAFAAASDKNQLTKNPIAHIMIGKMIKGKALVKDGKLKTHDLETIFYKMQTTPFEASFLVLTMLCFGFRIGETRHLNINFFDRDLKAWRIPTQITKTEQSFTTPITDFYLTQLEQYREKQKALCHYTGPLLFPNTRNKPINKNQANDYIQCLSNNEWTSHDLRKLARTYWADHDVDYYIAELLLNHKTKGLDLAYINTTALKLKRKALTEWHFFLAQKLT
jgi:integrase